VTNYLSTPYLFHPVFLRFPELEQAVQAPILWMVLLFKVFCWEGCFTGGWPATLEHRGAPLSSVAPVRHGTVSGSGREALKPGSQNRRRWSCWEPRRSIRTDDLGASKYDGGSTFQTRPTGRRRRWAGLNGTGFRLTWIRAPEHLPATSASAP
jgi:hypothetical protein